MDSPHTKANLLLQAHFARATLTAAADAAAALNLSCRPQADWYNECGLGCALRLQVGQVALAPRGRGRLETEQLGKHCGLGIKRVVGVAARAEQGVKG